MPLLALRPYPCISYFTLVALVTNAESLSFGKLTELEVVSESNLIDIIAVTEVQSHDPGSLRWQIIQSLLHSVLQTTHSGKMVAKFGFLLTVTFTQRLFKSLAYLSMMKSSG